MISGFKAYSRLLTYVKPYWLIFVAALFGNFLYAVVDAGFVKLLQPILDKGFVERNESFITWIPLVVVAIFAVRGVASFLSTYCMGWLARKIIMILRQEIYQKYLVLPAKFYNNNNIGELISRITFNVEQVANASTEAITVIVRESFTAIALVVVMLSISWQLTLVFIITVPLMAGLMHFVSMRNRRISSNVQGSMATVTQISGETVDGFKEIRIYGAEEYESNRFKAAINNNRQQEMKLVATEALSVPLVQLMGAFALAGMMYFATVSPNSITPGGFTAMIAAMIALLKPVKQLTKVNQKIQRGLAAAINIFTLLDEKQEPDNGAKAITDCNGEIEFKNVEFCYEAAAPAVLKDINLTIESGTTVALVGASGGGKSTLVNLLPRFYEASSGVIKIDGVNINDYKLADLRNQFAIVSQFITLFNDTVFNNVAYGVKAKASLQEVEAALKAAAAWDFVSALPQGVNTIIGDRGLKLSGGQRQRLAIARAILKNAPILILDEATSALDTAAERHIQQALDALCKGRTTLVIAHRLSTIEKADKIVVLKAGQIVEQGRHQQLMATNGHYAKLRSLQFSTVIATDSNEAEVTSALN